MVKEWFLWMCVILVLITGLLSPPIMDNDAAEYASIALKMHIDNDYANIINRDYDYLDKPHMLFWTAALSYKLFGISPFSYRIASVLVCLLGAFATYRLGKLLYNDNTGRWAALIFITSQAIMLSNHDVRTDSMLVGFVVAGVWLLTKYINGKKLWTLVAGAAAISLGVATKGMIAVIVAGCLLFFYIIFSEKWRALLDPQWLIGLLVFGVVLSPFLAAYYFQFDVHPEKLVNGQYGVSGVRFLLWDQSFERFSGQRNMTSNPEFFFFHHTFLWAFLPWTCCSLLAFINRAKSLTSFKAFFSVEQLTFLGTLTMFTVMSVSSFKLPHYINILFPFIAIATAAYLDKIAWSGKSVSAIARMQLVLNVLLIVFVFTITFYAFSILTWWAVLLSGLASVIVIGYYFNKNSNVFSRIIAPSVLTAAIINLILNTNFYPALTDYQAGITLAKKANELQIPHSQIFVFYQKYRSFDFYARTVHKKLTLDEIRQRTDGFYLVIRDTDRDELQSAGVKFKPVITVPDFRITRLNSKFLNPATREQSYSFAHLVKVQSD